MPGVLEELSAAVAELVQRVSPSVVGVGRAGSGLVMGDGLVVTNSHNLRGEEVSVSFAGGRDATGTVAAADHHGDLAVVRVETDGAPAAIFGQRAPTPGTMVLAMANPRGAGVRASLGVVSAVDLSFRGPGGRRVTGAFEHTAPLVRGASGGPVLDGGGSVVGVDTHRVGEGAYLAVAADPSLPSRLDALARGEAPRRPRLGVAVAPAHVARRLRRSVGLPERPGVLVHAVEEDGPAATAGIRQGDLLVAVRGMAVTDVDSLATALEEVPVGEPAVVELVRGTDEMTMTVELPDS